MLSRRPTLYAMETPTSSTQYVVRVRRNGAWRDVWGPGAPRYLAAVAFHDVNPPKRMVQISIVLGQAQEHILHEFPEPIPAPEPSHR